MKIRFLLIGTSLSLIPQTINAQCVATQDCATLGYTETSCSGGSGVKCPFGNKWACFQTRIEIEKEICSELGFTLPCTGSNQIGGAGKACNGKYASCSCVEGYEWKDGSCQAGAFFTGPQETAYYCKGNVVAVKTPEMDFYVGLYDLRQSVSFVEANQACSQYKFCDNISGTAPSKAQFRTISQNLEQLQELILLYNGVEMSGPYWTSERVVEDGSGYWSGNEFILTFLEYYCYPSGSCYSEYNTGSSWASGYDARAIIKP